MKIHVFYAGLLLKEFEYVGYPIHVPELYGLPDGAYIRYQKPIMNFHWYRSDFTPLADEHVPKELRVLALLLT